MNESKKGEQKRHIMKTITWRFVATGTTFLLAWLFTGNIKAATAIGAAEAVVKMFLYYLHERAWYKYVDFDRA